MIGIIDYGMGNIGSLRNIVRILGAQSIIVSKVDDLDLCQRIILPGVGSFDLGMKNLMQSGLIPGLIDFAFHKKKPVLGICLGMQLMANSSEEGYNEGLGWIPGKVIKFKNTNFRCPHVGWNVACFSKKHVLWEGISRESFFYYIHSYYFDCEFEENILSETEYGNRFHSSIQRNNILGVQFHPEKSLESGKALLKNFMNI